MGLNRILVVDDEFSVRETICILLEDEGYEVSCAASGEEALEIFKQNPFPLVISDVVMPGISGLELLTEIKKIDDFTQVIIVTSHYSIDSSTAALRQGAYDYLCKPFEDLELVLSAVNRTFETIHLQNENRKHIERYIEKNEELELLNSKLQKDIFFREQADKRIEQLAYYDDLTGLPNRVLFKDRLTQAIGHAERADHVVALLFLDLDRFKHINDSLGHLAGDRLLVSVTQRLKGNLRKSDTLARLGGDEFVIVLTSNNNENEVEFFARKVLRLLAQPFDIDGKKVFTSGSIGIVFYPHDSIDADILLKYADMAMYDAKAAGKNTYRLYSDELHCCAEERSNLEYHLRRAMHNDEFYLNYQPQIDMFTGELIGAEALMRWEHPEEGLISPAKFIPIAEEIGIIDQLGEWVLKEVCRQNVAWIMAGFSAIKISVNISGHQFRQSGLLRVIDRVLNESGMPPEYLEIELTETTLINDSERTIVTLQAFKKRGISISIDDFGIGYSSFNYLKHFPIDRIKIDRSFVAGLPDSKDDCAITAAIIAMCFSLGHKVVAEGVETRGQFECLKNMQCREVQGFLFGKPMGVEDFTAFINEKMGRDELCFFDVTAAG